MKKRLIAMMLSLVVLAGSIPANAFAEDSVTSETEETIANEGLTGRLEGNVPEEFYDTSYYSRAAVITHDERFDGYTLEEGIDVSYHNGSVNWEKVKASGVDFAIIRVGARGYGSAGTLIYDNQFINNIEGAKAAGIDVGVYFFSQAITTAEAIEEAEYVLDKIAGYDLELPVVFDFEYVDGGRLQRNAMTNRERTDLCKAFCEVIEAAGYQAMVYANRYTLTNDLYAAELAEAYDIWLAVYAKAANYTGAYSYWQYSESGSVSGIASNSVDMNYRYYLPYLNVAMRQKDGIYLDWADIEGAEGYNVYQKLEDGTYELLTQIEGAENSSFKHKDLAQNTEYTYKVCYYLTDENGQQTEYDTGYEEATGRTLVELTTPTLKATALTAGSVKLTWNQVENADGYIVQQYDSSTGVYKTVKTITNANKTTYTRTGLKIATTYKYRVKAYVNVGTEQQYSDYSSVRNVKTLSTLAKPVVTTEVKSYSKIQLSWERVWGATGYQIQRYNTSTKKYQTVQTITSGKTLTYINTGLSEKTTYKYRVRAFAKKSGETVYSSYSAAVSAKTSARVSTPKLTVSTKSYTSLKLSWSAISNASGYEIQRYDSSSKKYVTVKTITSGSTTAYTNTYLNSNTTYKYRIRAYRVISGKKYYSYYSTVQSAKTSGNRTGEVTCKTLYVRSGAGTKYKKLISLKKGDEVTITGSRSGGWYRVRIDINGVKKTGYVSKEYVKLTKL